MTADYPPPAAAADIEIVLREERVTVSTVAIGVDLYVIFTRRRWL